MLNTQSHPNLDRLGFKKGNPFATLEADQERAILDQIFVDIDNFERIRAARTVLVHAPRGCGKSAARVRLTNSLAPWSDSEVIETYAIEFIHFEELVKQFKASEKLTSDLYTHILLRLGAQSFFDFLFANGGRPARLENLSIQGQVKLGRLLWGYAEEKLNPENMHHLLGAYFPAGRIPWKKFRKVYDTHTLSEFLNIEAEKPGPVVSVLAFLLDMESDDRVWKAADPIDKLSLLLEVARHLGFTSLAVMVDRVDEIAATANDSEVQAALLEPFLANLPLMEMPGITYKFFIPTQTRDELLKKKMIRTDRLEVVEATVDWSEARLHQLLEKRLKFFGEQPDLSMYVSLRKEDQPDGDERLGEAIEREMIALAEHSPRRLIHAGQLLLSAYVQRQNADLLTWADWVAARDELMKEENRAVPQEEEALQEPAPQAGPFSAPGARAASAGRSQLPLLTVSSRRPILYLKKREIRLSETELKIIRALTNNGGAIEQEKLFDDVWDKSVTTSAIDVALKRIRDEIDQIIGTKKTALKYYLSKKSGTIMLTNYEICDD